MNLAVDFSLYHFRARYAQLVTFPAHGFDQYRQVQFTPAGDLELVGAVALLHAQRDVVNQFLFQAVLDIARGDVFAFPPGKGGVVDHKRHADRGFVHGQGGQGLDVIRVAQGVGNTQIVDAVDADDIPGAGVLGLHPVQPQVAANVEHLALALVTVGGFHHHRLIGAQFPAGDTPHADNPHIVVVIQRGYLHLERGFRVDVRCRHALDDHLVQRRHVLGHIVRVIAGDAVERRGVDHRKIQLFVVGAQVVEQVEHLVHDPVRPGARAVDLVDHHDRLQALLEGLGGHEPRLRHGAVHRVHQQQHRVHHRQDALDLAAEIGVARGVDDIDAVVVPLDGGVLRQDGDTALLFLVVGVHDPLGALVLAVQGAGLLQQLVHQRGLAVVDVGDNGDVAKFLYHWVLPEYWGQPGCRAGLSWAVKFGSGTGPGGPPRRRS